MQKEKREIVINAVKVVLLVLTLLSFLKAIWISLDIDESYAVAMGYRMARGNRLIRDMWEPHQFSGFLAAFFIAPYIRIHGDTDYLVIYLRIIGILIHTGLGLLLYRQLKHKLSHFFSFGITILHLNFLPKWVQIPEFELMHYWCLLGIFLALNAYFTGKKQRMLLLFIGGCFLVCGMLCYPTMIVLYPFYILAICILEKQCLKSSKENWWKSSFYFTLGAFLTGTIFLVHLFSYMSFAELKRYISYIFLDASHTLYTMGQKWGDYREQIYVQAKEYSHYLLLAVVIILVVCLVYLIVFYKADAHKETGMVHKKQLILQTVLSAAIAAFVLAGILMQTKAVYSFLFEDKNQFFLQVRYIAFLLPALLLGGAGIHHRETAICLYLCVIPGFISVPAVLFMTNMDTNATYAKAFFGVLGSLLILDWYSREILKSSFWKKIFQILKYTAGGMLLAGLLICRLILIRISGCLPVTVLAPLEKMEYGAEKGIWVLADTAEIWNDNYREIEKYIEKTDNVLYIGEESLIYAKMGATPVTPSTQNTTVYNEVFLYYFEEHPDRFPNVIIYDKTFGENPAYSIAYENSIQNPVLFQWIEENYVDVKKIETDYMIILRKD